MRDFSKDFLGLELDFFGVTFWAVGLLFRPGSSLKDFFGSNNFASFAHPRP